MEEDQLTKREKRELLKEEKQKEKLQGEASRKLRGVFISLMVLAALAFLGYKTYKYFTTPLAEVIAQPIEIADSDWVRGDKNSKAILIEYGDFQCPACVNYFALVEKLGQEITSKLS